MIRETYAPSLPVKIVIIQSTVVGVTSNLGMKSTKEYEEQPSLPRYFDEPSLVPKFLDSSLGKLISKVGFTMFWETQENPSFIQRVHPGNIINYLERTFNEKRV